MKLTKELILEIDLLIDELIEVGVVSENKCNSEIRGNSIRFLKTKGLLISNCKRVQYNPTSEVYEIKKVGIEKYLKEENRVEELDLKIKELTAINLNLQNKQLKRYILYSVISFVLGAISTNIEEILNFLNQ
ncbi:hypothetical protein FLSI110296_08845 [Flavobacterium sinopsychrotolerans]|uniref:Uncharacterized protein n=1 Tax=Flavobacterium sinopsychrotolerans TaxID=604089 RepID=A0A1H8PYJ4_9FLAO|nr:hypothetical protein [Flavobacterium sinopsychrotolerans]SEO46744.1 hypothetical protein SAMN04487942_2813 [Flavobacterium sinopsychrotolerans]